MTPRTTLAVSLLVGLLVGLFGLYVLIRGEQLTHHPRPGHGPVVDTSEIIVWPSK